MKVLIAGTNNVEVLELIDRKNGTDSVVDLIGNYDGLGNADHQFALDQDSGVYNASQDTYDWWAKVVADQSGLAVRIAELNEEHGADAVQEAIGNSGDCDLEDQAGSINNALDEAFGE